MRGSLYQSRCLHLHRAILEHRVFGKSNGASRLVRPQVRPLFEAEQEAMCCSLGARRWSCTAGEAFLFCCWREMDGNGGGVEMAVVEERNEKKHKKHKKRHHKSRDALELIVELEEIDNRSDKHADQAEQAEKQQESSKVAAAPTAMQQLPIEPIIASAPPPSSSKPKQDKEKGRSSTHP